MTLVIGLAGPAGSGKSSVGAYLAEHYGAHRYAFANPLKELIRRAFDMTEAQLYGTQRDKETKDPRYNVSPRWLMTHIGTEGIRSVFGPDIWAETTLKQICEERPKFAVIEDC